MKSTLAALEAERDRLSNVVSRGEERRSVEVEERADHEQDVYTRVRLDSGEVLERRPLHDDERQVPLPLDGGGKYEGGAVEKLTRHREAELARDLGLSPIVEVRAALRIRDGEVLALYMGPEDLAEFLRVREIVTADRLSPNAERPSGAREERGSEILRFRGMPVYLLREDLS